MHKSVLSILMSLSLAAPMANAKEPAQRETPRAAPAPVQRETPRAAPAPVQRETPRAAPAPVQRETPRAAPAPVQRETPRAAPAPVQRETPRSAPVQREAPRAVAPAPVVKAPAPAAPVAKAPAHEVKAPAAPAPVAPTAKAPAHEAKAPAAPAPEAAKPAREARERKPAPPPGVSQIAMSAQKAKIAAPEAKLTAAPKGPPKVNKDGSTTQHDVNGGSIRKSADGRVISQYDPKSGKSVYSNKDGSTTVAAGSKSVRSFQNGDKIVKNAKTGEVSKYDAAKQQTVTRAPGKTVVVNHATGVVQVKTPRQSYTQVAHTGGNGGYTRSVTINNVQVTRIYNNGYNRYGGYSSYYYPGIYHSPYYSAFVGGFYGGLVGVSLIHPYGYGWSVWAAPSPVCWWGGCGYSYYSPYSPYSWRGDYGYYYSPVVAISSPLDYLVGTIIAESLENRRQARLEREKLEAEERAERQTALAQADEEQAQILRAQAAEELKEAREERERNQDILLQIKDQQKMSPEAVKAQELTVNHVMAEVAKGNKDKPAALDVLEFLESSPKAIHGFQIHEQLEVGQEGTDKSCPLDEGDTIQIKPGFEVTKDTENIPMKVLSSVPGDCRPGIIVNVGLSKLQEMLNATVEKINDGMADLAKKEMGKKK